MLAAIRLRKTQPAARRSFSSPMSPWLQWTMIALLPLLGVASLSLQPLMGYLPMAIAGVLVALAVLGAQWATTRTVRVRALSRL